MEKIKISFLIGLISSIFSLISCVYIPDNNQNNLVQSSSQTEENLEILKQSDEYNDISKDYPIDPDQESKSILIYWKELQKIFIKKYDKNLLDKIENSLTKNESRIIEQYKKQKSKINQSDEEFEKLPDEFKNQKLYYEDIVGFLKLKKRLFIYSGTEEQAGEKLKKLEQENPKYLLLITIFMSGMQAVIQNEINTSQLILFKSIINWIKSINDFFNNANKSIDVQLNENKKSQKFHNFKEVFNELLREISKMLSLNNYLSLREPDAIFVGQNDSDYYKNFYLDLFKWISQDLNQLYYFIFKETNIQLEDLWKEQGNLINEYILNEQNNLKYSEFNSDDYENKAKSYLNFLKSIKLINFKN
ncbi:Uncharacterised protein [Mycoplasmopsis citelli]|uniref:Lipoprotein n=1 Tax=Mycoplasmopsis citelli TaxID=171281 RepID=A0A449B119_9BACT|nr:hypothetical protein [Mycoplasmopsis citelli]VEU74297.1 Uncharacterised protein [Mycoplasmopsis citelli]